MSDSFNNSSESLEKMIDKFDETGSILESYGDHFDDLTKAYNNNLITHEDYIKGLEESKGAMYENIKSLNALKKEISDYYSNTLSKAGEEIDKYASRMEHLTSVLDHYNTLLSLTGKQTDYQSMGVVLTGIAETMENSLAAS
jgi:methyl-accepting chemotaxis protein